MTFDGMPNSALGGHKSRAGGQFESEDRKKYITAKKNAENLNKILIKGYQDTKKNYNRNH